MTLGLAIPPADTGLNASAVFAPGVRLELTTH